MACVTRPHATGGAPLADAPALAVLTAERARRVALVDALHRGLDAMVAASEGSNADDEHDTEGTTIAFERSQLSTQLAHAGARVDELDRAIARARGGSYGTCVGCGGAIGRDRLEALPAATTCISCAAR